jgi:pimeloyl-ACP methyl ester carboxylesterase
MRRTTRQGNDHASPNPVSFRPKTVPACTYNIIAAGTRAPTCLLLHGFGDGGYVREDTSAALADVCSTGVLDLRGHGDSGPSPSGIYDLDMNLRDVRTVIARLGLTRLILAGHSFGGEIILRLAPQPITIAAIFVDIAPTVDIETAHQATVYIRETMRPYKSIEEYSSLLKDMRMRCPRPLHGSSQGVPCALAKEVTS